MVKNLSSIAASFHAAKGPSTSASKKKNITKRFGKT